MRIFLINLLILFTVILLASLVGEMAFRYYLKAWPFENEMMQSPYLSSKDKNLRWRFSSNDGRNGLGLRNREISAKKNGDFRILFLGDSLIWDGETSQERLYTQVIEERLNAEFGGKNNIEVINAGIPGYTTYQELEFLRLY